jgi:hypothetical protein
MTGAGEAGAGRRFSANSVTGTAGLASWGYRERQMAAERTRSAKSPPPSAILAAVERAAAIAAAAIATVIAHDAVHEGYDAVVPMGFHDSVGCLGGGELRWLRGGANSGDADLAGESGLRDGEEKSGGSDQVT